MRGSARDEKKVIENRSLRREGRLKAQHSNHSKQYKKFNEGEHTLQ